MIYWIYPSKQSCIDRCGLSETDADCSCNESCMRKGNCCDNFDKACPEEKSKEQCSSCNSCSQGHCESCKPNSASQNGQCLCQPGHSYNNMNDICELSSQGEATPSSHQDMSKSIWRIWRLQRSNGIQRQFNYKCIQR